MTFPGVCFKEFGGRCGNYRGAMRKFVLKLIAPFYFPKKSKICYNIIYMNNIVVSSAKFIIIDIIGDFVYWPVWWYTVGVKNAVFFCGRQIREAWLALALGIWLKNLFTPMYDERSIFGRAISLVMRIVVLLWKMAWLALWMAIILALLMVWLLAPIAVIWVIREHLKVLF